jgi:signal transduction histidine kinase
MTHIFRLESMSHLFRLGSIPARFTAMAAGFILVVSLAAGVIGIRLSLNFGEAQFHKHFRVVSVYLAKNSELGLLLGERSMLESLADNMLAVKDVFRVAIRDAEGGILVESIRKAPVQNLVTVETPVSLTMSEHTGLFVWEDPGNHVLGSVEVTYSLEDLELLQKRMITYFILLFPALAAVFSLGFFFVSRSVALPLQRILSVAGAVSKGQMDIRADTKGPGSSLREIRTLAAGFNDMLDALELAKSRAEAANEEMARQKTLAEVGKFSMMVAHEVKNPLAVIKGSLEILKKDNLKPGIKQELIKYVEDDIQRINKIVEEFLVFARPRKPDLSEMDMNRLVARTLEKFWFVDPGKHMEADVDTGRAVAECDPAMMERALVNLLNNAVSFAARTVRVTTSMIPGATSMVRDSRWRLKISDDGPGIPPDKLNDIFAPFYTTRSRGTGLGLAIVKDIMHTHNADIRAGNNDAGGAWFEINMECRSYGRNTGS